MADMDAMKARGAELIMTLQIEAGRRRELDCL